MAVAINVSENKKFKNQTFDLKKIKTPIDLVFSGDKDGQIVAKQSGKNIVVTVYALKDGVVDTSKTLGKYTLKNGNKKNSGVTKVSLKSEFYDEDLLIEYYAPQKKKNTYIGNWQNNEVVTTSANETFKLGGGENEIDFNITENFGNDTVYTDKNAKTVIYTPSGTQEFERKGNDVIINANSEPIVPKGNGYMKQISTISVDEDNNYTIEDYNYSYNTSIGDYNTVADEAHITLMSLDEYLEYIQKFYENYKIQLSVGENTIYYNDENDIIIPKTTNLGKITLKNYLKNGVDNVYLGDRSLKRLLEDKFSASYLGKSNSINKQKITGSFLNETFVGGSGNDTIKTGKGDDYILTSKGSDTVTINGSGNKTIWNFSGDNTNIGNMTVKFSKGLKFGTGENETQLDISAMQDAINHATDYYLPEDTEHSNLLYYSYFYQKSGNDLVLSSNYEQMLDYVWGDEKTFTPTAKLTIKNFFKNKNIENTTIIETDDYGYKHTLADTDNYLRQIGNYKKSNKISDTKYRDSLYGGSKKDTFTISHGNAEIIGGKGNDVINVKKSATSNITISSAVGSGNDTLKIDSKSTATIYIQPTKTDLLDSKEATLSFDFKGKDLIYKITYNQGATEYNPDKEITDKITIKNFFTNNNWRNNVQFAYGEDKYASLGLVMAMFGQSSYYDKVTKTTIMTGSAEDDTYTYLGTGKAEMQEKTGSFFTVSDDIYNLKISDKSNLRIYDNGGYDTIVFDYDINKLKVFVNYDNSSYLAESVRTSPNIIFFAEDCLTSNNIKNYNLSGDIAGGIVLSNYYGNQRKDGSTFTFKHKNGEVLDSTYINEWINKVKENVTAWVKNQSDYAGAIAAFEGNDVETSGIKDCYLSYGDYLDKFYTP